MFRNLTSIASFFRKNFGQNHVSDIFGRTATSRLGHRTDFGQKFSESGTTIQGNEKADAAAKVASRSAHNRPLKVEANELKPTISRLILDEWQARWHNEPDCALRRLRPNINRLESSSRRSRIEEVALTRLRIGHCHATHSHHLTSSEPPVCDHCSARLTVKHVLSPSDICEQLRAIKSRYFHNAPLDDVLGGYCYSIHESASLILTLHRF